jgi:hypothetical protein
MAKLVISVRNAFRNLALKDRVALMLSVLAAALSVISFYSSRRSEHDVAVSTTIKTEYDVFKELTRAEVEYTHLSHLFAQSYRTYEALSDQTARGFSPKDERTKAKLLLEERGMADYIFTSYEETYLNWDQANKAGDDARASLLLNDLGYFKGTLCNPRLLWYWDLKGGHLALAYGLSLQNYYQENVRKSCPDVLADPDGPFQHLATQ